MQEERFLRLDGSVVEVEVFAVGLHYGGRPAVQVMARDITARKTAEAALRAAEKRFHCVWQQSNDGMRLTDAEGRLLAVNDAYCRLVDLPRAALEGQLFNVAYDTNSADPVDDGLARYRERFAQRAIPLRIERRVTLRNSRVADLEISSTFLDIGGGQVVLLGLFRDVTEQRRSEAALREGEEKFSKAFQFSPAMMGLSRLEDGTYLEVNETFVRKTGFSREEVVGHTSVELGLLRPADRARILEVVREHSVVRDFEVSLRTKHGHLLYGVFAAEMITVGGRRCLLSTVADITARKEAEAARESLARALESKNRELATLVYATSHDLRSPLLNIQGFSARVESSCAELVRLANLEAPTPADRAAATDIATVKLPKALGYVQAGVAKMDQLINGLLRLSRLDRAGLRPEQVAMEALCSELLAAMAFSLQQAGATVEIGALPTCAGDPGLLSQLFSNLVDNAVKYRDPKRPLVIRVTGRIVGGRSEYCVADNGLGISAAHLSRIWEVFFRVNPRDGAGGEGLGLNLVRRIAERHRGEVWVESTLGEGSRFFVALPTAVAAATGKEHP
jgi:PAS domain S-box-containing protein